MLQGWTARSHPLLIHGFTTMTMTFGSPGVSPKWTRSGSKQGIGTAYHTSCHTWFSHGILNEIYYPNVDCPNTRDLQFLITDGEAFCHGEKRDLDRAGHPSIRRRVDHKHRVCSDRIRQRTKKTYGRSSKRFSS